MEDIYLLYIAFLIEKRGLEVDWRSQGMLCYALQGKMAVVYAFSSWFLELLLNSYSDWFIGPFQPAKVRSS